MRSRRGSAVRQCEKRVRLNLVHKIQVFYHTRQISDFPCVKLYTNSEAAVQRCYVIMKPRAELVKLENE